MMNGKIGGEQKPTGTNMVRKKWKEDLTRWEKVKEKGEKDSNVMDVGHTDTLG